MRGVPVPATSNRQFSNCLFFFAKKSETARKWLIYAVFSHLKMKDRARSDYLNQGKITLIFGKKGAFFTVNLL